MVRILAKTLNWLCPVPVDAGQKKPGNKPGYWISFDLT